MRDLATPEEKPVPWTFRAVVPCKPRKTRRGSCVVARVYQVTVQERLFIDARSAAAQILGVDFATLEHVR